MIHFFQDSWRIFRALYRYFNPVAYLTSAILLPAEQMLFYVLLGRYVGGDERVRFLILGNCIVVAGLSGFWSAHLLAEERAEGTLALLIAAPSSRVVGYLKRAVFYVVNGLVTVGICLLLGGLMFGVDFTHTNALALALAILCCVASSLAAGLVLGALVLAYADAFLLTNAAYVLVFLAAGVTVPISGLPGPLQAISPALPFSHGITAARGAFSGASLAEVSGSLMAEGMVAAAYFVVGLGMLATFERIAVRSGSLEKM